MQNKKLLLMIAGLLFVAKFFIVPFFEYIDSAENSLHDNQKLYNRLAEVNERKPLLDKQSEFFSEAISNLESRYFNYSLTQQPVPLVLEKVRAWADDSKVEITNIEPHTFIDSEQQYLPFTVSVKGNRNGILNFVKHIEGGDQLSFVSQFTVYNDNPKGDSFLVVIDVVMLMKKQGIDDHVPNV